MSRTHLLRLSRRARNLRDDIRRFLREHRGNVNTYRLSEMRIRTPKRS